MDVGTTCKSRQSIKLAAILIISAIIAACSKDWFVTAQSLPPDARRICPDSSVLADKQLFANWFESGYVKVDGFVKPANSLAFQHVDNCSFYRWAEQMFLWLTSPTPGKGGGRVFNSPAFYGVSQDPSDKSKLIFTPKAIYDVRVAKLGSNNLPVVRSKQGLLLEVATQKPLFTDGLGKPVEVDRAKISENGKLLLFDKAGNAIHFPSENVKPKGPIVQKFIVDGTSVFVDPYGNIIDIEVGQAEGGEVLMTKNTSLVYYTTAVNDAFAYFLTGVKNGEITPTPTEFPTRPEDLDKIIAVAWAHGKTLAYPNALVVEIKAAWVEVDKLPDPNNASSYITAEANVPKYNKSPTKWTLTGQTRKAKLALVGLHVVGSAKGHSEMIWATFEHFGNTPNATYNYEVDIGIEGHFPKNITGNWLFCGTCSGPFDIASIEFNMARVKEDKDGNLVPMGGVLIEPSDTRREHPWGAPVPQLAASSNTQIINMNNFVLRMLPNGDVRKNYLFIGATWTHDGKPPIPGNQVGANQLANSTMETYQQNLNCFVCHNQDNMLGTPEGGGLSHIWGPLRPLSWLKKVP
jgi:hypothetical protein